MAEPASGPESEASGLLDGIDLTNPCLVWPRLQEAYYRLLAGERETTIRFDGRREVQFQAAKVGDLAALIARLRSECEAKAGRRRGRALMAEWRH